MPPGAGPDRIERSLSFDIKPFRVDSLKRRKISGELSQSLSQLQFGACPVPPPVVIEADGEMNHRLEKQLRFAVSGPPQVLERFMALEELAGVEKFDPAPELGI